METWINDGAVGVVVLFLFLGGYPALSFIKQNPKIKVPCMMHMSDECTQSEK